MKTKITLLIGLLIVAISLGANNNSRPAGRDNLRNQVQSRVNSEVYKWDFSSVDARQCKAFVSFRIDKNGQAQIVEILCDNDAFKSLIASKLPESNLGLYEPGTIYQVSISFKRI